MSILIPASRVLGCFNDQCTELTVTDVVDKLGIPKSNASRLLRAMRDVNLLETVGNSKRFRPGVLILNAAASYRKSSRLVERAVHVVTRISRASGHTAYVSKLVGDKLTAVADHEGSHALRVVLNSGRLLEAPSCATGRALLALMSDQEVKDLFPTGFKPVSDISPQSMSELFERIKAIRQDGISFSSQESTRGVDALAVAVRDPATSEAIAICVVYPASLTQSQERQALEQLLLEGAAELSRP